MRALRPNGGFLALFCALAASTVSVSGQTDEPRDTGITESVDVQLVLLDVTVVDKNRGIVTGLTQDDFVLRVDNEVREIVSLDMQCPEEPVSEPHAVDPGSDGDDWQAPDRERRIVFAVDYRHLEQVQRVDVLRQISNAVLRLHQSREELMVVALADFLRVELPFTTDGVTVEETLERMENDISLWLPPFDHLHDGPTFESLFELTDLLSSLPGDKVVVLYSNWPGSGMHYDALYDELTSRAAKGRVTFYPVWTRGLKPRGTSRRLARLAVETGGRFTERTNDFSLGYARAQRDTACRYTLGFHDTGEEPARVRRVDLRVEGRGIRVHHPDRYKLGDPEQKIEDLARAVLAWPELFASEDVHVRLIPVRPLTRKRWEAVVAVEAGGAGEVVQVRTRLRRGNSRWKRPSEQRLTPLSFSDGYRLRHGDYVASTSVSRPDGEQPAAAEHRLTLPELDAGLGLWIGDPLVLRALWDAPVDAEDLEGTALEGDPLDARVPVLARASTDDPLSILLAVCRYGATEEAEQVDVGISVSNGEQVVFESARTLELAQGTRVRCADLDASLPSLPPGSYTATSRVDLPGEEPQERRQGFEIVETRPPDAGLE